ncbi:MAG: hypothetical protein P1U34_04735 [Coxiellaceae bacterium]|nr:hypothetical protein [Coxiellaceae bacterium]
MRRARRRKRHPHKAKAKIAISAWDHLHQQFKLKYEQICAQIQREQARGIAQAIVAEKALSISVTQRKVTTRKTQPLYNELISICNKMLTLLQQPGEAPCSSSTRSPMHAFLQILMLVQNYRMEASELEITTSNTPLEALINRTATIIHHQPSSQQPTRKEKIRAFYLLNSELTSNPKEAISAAFWQYVMESYITLINQPLMPDEFNHQFFVNLLFILESAREITHHGDDATALAALSEIEEDCERFSDEELLRRMNAAILHIEHTIHKDGTYDLTSTMMIFIKLIHATPAYSDKSPCDYFSDLNDLPIFSHPSQTVWLKNCAQRQATFHANMEVVEELEAEVEEDQLRHYHREVARRLKQEAELSAHIATLSRYASEPELEEDETGDEESKPDATPQPAKRYFPYIESTYEKLCCQIHLDLSCMIRKVRRLISSDLHQNAVPGFRKTHQYLYQMLEKINSAPSVDANHAAQIALFTVGCYLQFVRAHKHHWHKLEAHLTRVSDCTRFALETIKSLQKKNMEGMSQRYRDELEHAIDQINECHSDMVSIIDRNSQHTAKILKNAKARLKAKGLAGKTKPQHLWHPASRTLRSAREHDLVDGAGKATKALVQLDSWRPSRQTSAPLSLFTGPTAHPLLKDKHGQTAASTEAKAIVASIKTAPTPVTPTPQLLDSRSWLQDVSSFVDDTTQFIAYDHPDFLAIMEALHAANPELSTRMRLHGGALRDFLINPLAQPSDFDMEFFGTYEQLKKLLPDANKPIIISDSSYGVILVKAFIHIAGTRIPLDITLHRAPADKEGIAYAMSQPSNSDFPTNGSYTFKLPGGKYAILNYKGCATPSAVIDTLESSLEAISSATFSEDPLLILRALKLQGEFGYPFSESLIAQLTEADSTFDFASLPENKRGHFVAYFHKEMDKILAATHCRHCPNIHTMLTMLEAEQTTQVSPRYS